jgi:hypothetical protein
MLVGLKSLTHFYDDLRYSLVLNRKIRYNVNFEDALVKYHKKLLKAKC